MRSEKSISTLMQPRRVQCSRFSREVGRIKNVSNWGLVLALTLVILYCAPDRIKSSCIGNDRTLGGFIDIAEKVKEIICEQLSVEESEVTDDASFVETLNADSLDIVELIMAFEEAFDIEIPDEQAEKIRSVGDAIAYVTENK